MTKSKKIENFCWSMVGGATLCCFIPNLLLYALLFILFEAVGEGFLNRTQSAFRDFIFKGWVQLVIAVLLFAIWFVAIAIRFDDYFVPITKLVLGYVFVRFGIFDLTYNLANGQKWNYYGTVKLYDKIMSKLGGFGWFLKAICLIMGVVFLMGGIYITKLAYN